MGDPKYQGEHLIKVMSFQSESNRSISPMKLIKMVELQTAFKLHLLISK